jgi:hypothetical protein
MPHDLFNFLGTTLVAAALGVALALVFAQITAEYCVHIQDWDLCRVDNVKAMLSGGAIGGAAGFLWAWRAPS